MANWEESRPLGYRWVALGAMWLAWLVNVMDRGSMPSVLPFIRAELRLDHAQVGLIGSIYLLGYALAQFSAGILADRFGPKRTMHVAMLAGVMTSFTGLVGGFTQLLLLRVGVAIGEGHQWAPGLRAQADWFPQHEKGRASAIVMSGGTAGLALMPLLASLTIAATGSWRTVFFWLGAAAVLVLIGVRRFFFDTPKEAVAAGRMGFSELDYIRRGLVQRQAGDGRPPLRLLLRDPMLWIYSALAFFAMAVYYGATVWLVSFLYEQHGFSLAAMGAAAGLPYFVGLIALFVGAWLVDKRGAVKSTIVVSFLVLIPIFYFTASARAEVPLLILLLALLGFFTHLAWTPIYSYQVRRYPKEMVGAAVGISNGISMLGSFLSPVVAGYLVVPRDGGYSFQNVFTLLMALAAISAVTALFLREGRFTIAKSKFAKERY